MIPNNLLMAGVTAGIMDLLGTEVWSNTMVGAHWRAWTLLVTFPIGLLCLQKLSRRIAAAKWN